MHKFVIAAAMSLAAFVRADNTFLYDKADEIVPEAKLDNPLYYDPSIAVTGSNTFLVTWLEFQPGKGDVVWFGIRNSDGKWTNQQRVTQTPGDFSNPTVTIVNQTNVWLSYETAINGKWNVIAGKRDREGNFSFFNVSAAATSPGANVNHRVAAAGDRIWVVWQGDQHGEFDIFARELHDGAASPTSPIQQISDSPLGDWHPAVTTTADGKTIIAWDSYDGTNYNIRARVNKNGSWGETLHITSSTNFNANVQITSDRANRVWLSWEEDGPNWGKPYRTRVDAKRESHHMSDDIGSLHRFRKLHVAELLVDRHEVRTRELPQPAFDAATTRTSAPDGVRKLGVFYQSPQLTVDGADRLWIVYRHFYMPGMGITHQTHVQNDWGIYARCLDKDSWSQLYRMDEGQGDALQRISIAPRTNGIALAWTFGRTDRRNPQNWFEDTLAPDKVVAHVAKRGDAAAGDEEEGGAKAKGKQKTAKTKPANANTIPDQSLRGVAMATVGCDNTPFKVPATGDTISIYRGEIKERILAKRSRPQFSFNGKSYELFYGDFHRHTDISLCFWPGDGTMDDAYRYGIDAAPLDFLGVTDHTHDIAMGDPLSLLWQRIRKEVNRHALQDSFVPFYSYERSRGETDHNVISLRDDMLRPHTYPHSEFWKELDTNTITIPHQPFNSVLWKTNDREHRPLMEIFQGFRNHTCESDAKNGLASGNEVGFIASSDHLSTGASYACVWAEQPTRESIFAALKARRTYAATDHVLLRVTCGDHWMGEKFTVNGAPTIRVDYRPNGFVSHIASSTTEGPKIELFIDGEVSPGQPSVTNRSGAENLCHFIYNSLKLVGSHTVFVRITQPDGNMAWSSPMWITVEP